jgi:hypothetical protein
MTAVDELEGGAVHGAVARKIADGADLIDLQRQAERWLDGERARHLPVTSPPMRELAAPALLARLRAAGDVPPPPRHATCRSTRCSLATPTLSTRAPIAAPPRRLG